jgi:hypothetical protein
MPSICRLVHVMPFGKADGSAGWASGAFKFVSLCALFSQ